MFRHSLCLILVTLGMPEMLLIYYIILYIIYYEMPPIFGSGLVTVQIWRPLVVIWQPHKGFTLIEEES